ncbi:PAS domain S-box protein [Candidatus Venteria ishoeyi]|uniref:Sensor protein FixL n=1 Tax=Candidatus Venteria ishoeyi TaxID=1899563 RepID=A0A1H6FAH6_9GAMM|nr:PAS domain S-box protein [Candidatus Venteria ishoeyi]MDM8546536.1 PAS domain S-box protein [Candidatus Venteria ishoeyi]SEH07110.1 Sensor protein FixL [Candidatus Venteria ishoeyi]
MSNTPHHSRFFWRTSAMFAILDFHIRFKEVNSAWEKSLGLSTGMLLAKSLIDFVHPDDRPSTQYYLEQLREGSVSTSFSNRFRHQNGEYRHLLWEITSAASQEDAFYVVAMDISGRERPSIAEEMINVLDEGVVLQYANGTIGACNPSAERILGLSSEQMIGWTLVDPDWNIIREDGKPFPSETHPAICTLRTGQPSTGTVLGVEKPDGHLLWLNVNAHPLWRDEMTPYAVVISFSDITTYKQTEMALRNDASSTNPQTVTEDLSQIEFWDWDLEANSLSLPPQWKRMLGYDEEALMNVIDTWYQRIHPVDYKRVVADIENHLEGMTDQFENTHRLQHKDGSYRWTRCRGRALRDTAGKPVHIIGMHVDITSVQQAEDQYQLSETRYQQLMETTVDAVFLADDETDKIIDANRAAMQMYGYNLQEFLHLHRHDLSAQVEKTTRKRPGRHTRRRHHKRQDETVFPVEVTTSPFVLQGKNMLLLVVRETTERQQLETSLWESQSKYRQLFEASSSATIVFDANTQQVFDVNNIAVTMYGYTKEEWLHLSTNDLSAEPSKSRTALYTGTRHQVISLRWHKKRDGTVFPVEISVGSSYLFQGRSLVCATLRDITERRAQEEALRSERDFVKTLVEGSPTFFLAIEPDGNIRMLNRALQKVLGYETDSLLGQNFLEALVPEDERQHMNLELDLLSTSMRPALVESQIYTKDNEIRLVEWHSRAVVKADGSLDYLFGVGIDITEREKNQADLTLFKSIIDASEESVAIARENGDLVYINPAYTELFGCTLEQPLQNEHCFPPESKEIINREIRPQLQQGQGWSGELNALDVHKKRFHIWQRTDAVRDKKGHILYQFSLMHDISERKKIWENMRAQWEEYQQILDTVPMMIWHRNPENHLLLANKPAVDVFGKEDDYKAFYSDNQGVLLSGESKYETLDLRVDAMGGKRRLQVGRIPYRNISGKITGLVVFAMDITDCAPHSFADSYHLANTPVRKLIEHLPLLLNAVNDKGQIIAWNAASEQISGYTAREILSNPAIIQRLYPEPAKFESLTSGSREHQWQAKLHCKDGTQRRIQWRNIGLHYPIPGWTHWQLGQVVETGDLSQNESMLHNEMQMTRDIFNVTRIAMSVTDDRGRFVQLNYAYADLYGYHVEDLVGKPFTMVLPETRHDEVIREYFSLLISSDQPRFITTDEQHRDGSTFHLASISHRVLMENSKRFLVTFSIPVE